MTDDVEDVGRQSAIELFEASRSAQQRGDSAKALTLAMCALNGKVPRPAHYEHAARLLYDLGMYRMTELVARGAIEAGLAKSSIHAVLARALTRRGDLASALAQFDIAVELAPENEGLRRFRDKVAVRTQSGDGELPGLKGVEMPPTG